jgi:hypothetical protein
MKKIFATTLAATLLFSIINSANAQSRRATSGGSYNTALGLGLDFGDGSTLVGPSIKHFFTTHDAGKAEVLFGDHTTNLSIYYQYHGDIQNANGLRWTLGLGGTASFYSFRGYDQTDFAFRPTAGLDYKIPNVPIQFEFDWRPAITVTHGSDFTAARFGFGFRYCF